MYPVRFVVLHILGRKTYPDEKGIETSLLSLKKTYKEARRKTCPDEKGIETQKAI